MARPRPLGRRRLLLAGSAAAALVPVTGARALPRSRSRTRPGDAAWPSAADWAGLRTRLRADLVVPASPLEPCRTDPQGASCAALFHDLKNPYAIGDSPALTQTCGWVDAWTAQPSARVVAAHDAADVAAAVDFARAHDLRLVVKGGGHSYLGASCAPDSLMIWTRPMDAIALHDGFVPAGAPAGTAPVPAVSVGAGAIWMHVYDAVTTRGGRYVQGGGCGTVGVAGLVQGGGFGSHSKAFGTAGAWLLEAEVVTADGAIRVVNAWRDPELFWALKGGGGGNFGVVARMTLRTWDLPASFGAVSFDVQAGTDAAFRDLVGRFVAFYAEHLCNPHWGELVRVEPGRKLAVGMNFQGLDRGQVQALWQPFLDWLATRPDLAATPATILAGPGRVRWDGATLMRLAPGVLLRDDRPGAPAGNVFWAANLAEAGHVIHDFQSLWLPDALLHPDRQAGLAEALVAAARHWTIEMHVQKGLAGAPADVLDAVRDTPINPAVTRSFMLAIVASEGPPAFPGLPGHAPDAAKARRDRARIALAMDELRKVAPEGGSYVAECSYFLPDWQHACWGGNYARLQAVKARYDPDGLFFVRHGVGSEAWTEDGFTRLA